MPPLLLIFLYLAHNHIVFALANFIYLALCSYSLASLYSKFWGSENKPFIFHRKNKSQLNK